jgi:hypothetical protein
MIEYLGAPDSNRARFRMRMPLFLAQEWYRCTAGLALEREQVARQLDIWSPGQLRPRTNSQVECEDQLLAALGSVSRAAVDCADLMLSANVCPEHAWAVLPGTVMTEFIETGPVADYAALLRSPATTPDLEPFRREIAASLNIAG